MTTNPDPSSAVAAVSFVVYGKPAPQGSKNGIAVQRNGADGQKEYTGKVVMLESAKEGVDAWRAEVEKMAHRILQDERQRIPFLGAVSVGMGFTVRRGKTVRRPLPSVRPDISKYVRATEDAITDAGLWGDDGLVVGYHWLEKVYAGDAWILGERAGMPALDEPGCLIEIRALEPNPELSTRKPPRPRVSATAPVPPGARLASADGRTRLRGPVTPVEPSPALLEALRASGDVSEDSLWT